MTAEPSCETPEQPRRETERTLESRYWTDEDALPLPGIEDFTNMKTNPANTQTPCL